MAQVAFLFPGQGSQKVGMGKTICEADPRAASIFDEADEALGYSMRALCFEGPEEKLKETENTQPAIVTTSVALLRSLDRQPDVVAGHSLGEYSANVCAGSMQFRDAVRTVRARGRYMQNAVPIGAGAMAAVMFKDVAAVERVCAETEGVVEPVNYNSPGQLVIAGETASVAAAGESLKALGAKVIALPVSAPFHCSLMKPAEQQLEPDLSALDFRDPVVPIYTNVDAAKAQTAEAVRSALVRQVSRPVRWEQTIRAMLNDGVALFVEVGPGKVLSSLVTRIEKSALKINVSDVEDLEAAREAIDKIRPTS